MIDVTRHTDWLRGAVAVAALWSLPSGCGGRLASLEDGPAGSGTATPEPPAPASDAGDHTEGDGGAQPGPPPRFDASPGGSDAEALDAMLGGGPDPDGSDAADEDGSDGLAKHCPVGTNIGYLEVLPGTTISPPGVRTYTGTWIAAAMTKAWMTLGVEGATGTFEADLSSLDGQAPNLGTYPVGTSTPGVPLFSMVVDNGGCSFRGGSYALTEFEAPPLPDASSSIVGVTAIAMSFDVYCNVSRQELRGCLRYKEP